MARKEEKPNAVEKWPKQLEIIRDEVRNISLGSTVFWEVQRILEANPKARSHRLFNDWLMTNYAVATAIGIRRQLDRDPRSVSLANLLADISRSIRINPDVLSRSAIEHLPPSLLKRAEEEFDRLAGVGTSKIRASHVELDLKKLVENIAIKEIALFVNKRIAHRDSAAVQKRMLGELDECLMLLARLVDRYLLLLTGHTSGIGPILPRGWKSVFTIAWIAD